MTETERKKIIYNISLIQHTKPHNVYIERIETVNEKERKVFVTCKGIQMGALVCGCLVLYMWRVLS